MFSYINEELVNLIPELFPVGDKKSIMGHSMGGHGAIISALKTQQYVCVSSFAPICNLKDTDWGRQAFREYGVSDQEAWNVLDLVKETKNRLPFKMDYGTHDEFLEKEL